MKTFSSALLLVFVSSVYSLADPAEELATKVIRAEVLGYYVKGQTGTRLAGDAEPLSSADELALAAAINSKHALRKYMLSDQVPQRIRYMYAIQILLAREQSTTSDAKSSAIRTKIIQLGSALQSTP